MPVPNILAPPGVKHVVGLLFTNPTVGDPSFTPGSIAEASGASGSSLLPVYPTIIEGPTSQGSVTRLLFGANSLSNQVRNILTASSTINAQNVLATIYPYDPATAGPNKDIRRATGGELSVANPLYAEGAVTSDTGERAGQDIRAFLYAVDSATPTQAVRLNADASGNLNVNTAGAPPATITTAADFQTIAATVSTLIAANLSRSQAIIQNLDGTNFIRVGDASIGAAQGIIVAPGESITLTGTYAISVFPVAGTPLVSRTEIEA